MGKQSNRQSSSFSFQPATDTLPAKVEESFMSQSSSGSHGSGSNPSDFEPPSVEDLDAVLDAYEFIEILGRGGMGAVYKARQTTLDRIVAIKILPKLDDENDEFHFAERFQREARAMARLSHPNIIGVIDFGQTGDGQLYIVMEYVEGSDLHVLIRGGQLTTEHLFGWMSQICDAMQYAHSRGIVHRDIKPANIMINTAGVVKIADFGLAKLGEIDAQTTRLTMTNVAMGTPDYVAPEVLEEGFEPDHRADLYALGVMVYQMLTGKIPRGAWRPPSTLAPGLDPRFDDLVVKAMDADPDSRFQHASEIGAQLSSIQSTRMSPQLATRGGAKFNLPGSDTATAASDPAVPAGSSQEIPTTPAEPVQAEKGTKRTLIAVGSIVVCLAAAGLLTWSMKKRADHDTATAATGTAAVPDHSPAGAPPAAKPPPDLSPAPVPEPSSAPETPTEKTPPRDSGSKTAAAPSAAAGGETIMPEREATTDTTGKPDSDSPTTAAYNNYAGDPLLPVRRALHLHSDQPSKIEVPSLHYDRDQPWTFELWISAPTPADPMALIAAFDGVVMCVNYDQAKTAAWHVGYIGVMGRPIKDNQRQHLAFQGDGTDIEIFVDGVSAGRGAISGIPNEHRGEHLVIGQGTRGLYDEIRFSQVTRYAGNFTPEHRFEPDPDTLALWHLDDLSDELAVDSSGNGHDIRLADFRGWSWDDQFSPDPAPATPDENRMRQVQRAWAQHFGVPVQVENSIGMRFQLLPAGHFRKGEQSASDSFIRSPFYLGAFEVTQAEFAEIMDDNPSSYQEGGRHAAAVAGLDTRTHPVETTGIFDAARFCNRLSEREGLIPAYRTEGFKLDGIEGANGYRLPTSEEWEYACRAGSTTAFFDGSNSPDYSSLQRFARAGGRTYPVGEKLPNPFGIHDLQGNVCELVNGKYGSQWTVFEPVVRFGGFRRNRSVNSWTSWMQEEVRWQHKSPDLGFRVVLPSLATVADLPTDRDITRVTPPHPAVQKMLSLENEVRADFAKKVETPHTTAVQRLSDQFRNALNQGAGKAKGPAKALFQAESDRFESRRTLPDDDTGLPPAIVQLRETWRQQNAKLLADRAQALERFWPRQAERLQLAAAQFDSEGLTFYSGKIRALATRLNAEFRGGLAAGDAANALTQTLGNAPSNAGAAPKQKVDWIRLFDSGSLDGWSATGSARSFSLDRDAIKASGEPGFLYYTGDAFYGARFRDFDFRAQVKTEGGANSGVFFHTARTAAGFPSGGYEVQIHNGGQDQEKTGSLVGIANAGAEETSVGDGEWFDLEVSVRGRVIVTKINGKVVVSHEQPADWQAPAEYPRRSVFEGTFALQCHFPESGATWFRNIEVRPYKDPLTLQVEAAAGSIERQVPDPSTLSKGRLHAFGVDAEGKPVDLQGLDRGNDFVDVIVRSDLRVALRSRGFPVTADQHWASYEKDRFAKVAFGNSGEPGILRQDGTLLAHGKPPVVWPAHQPVSFVDVTCGYNSMGGLGDDGQIYLNVARHYVDRMPPLGPTDIVKIAQWHSTLWCLRNNGQLVWCGGLVPEASMPPVGMAQHRIVDLVAEAPGIALARSEKGLVFLWGEAASNELRKIPETARSDVAEIRLAHGGMIAAVRKKSGQWIAWGSDKFGVVSKINQLGPEVVEMAFTESQLLWIE